jgi:DNA-binding transcriptional MocR family regulator
VRSFSKSHGPDLRIGALGGPRALVDRVVARRLLGPGWTSRMTQALLFELLTDPDSVAEIGRARDTYAARQAAMAQALQGHGVPFAAGDGINAWLRVADERDAIVQLTASGIRVAPGTPFQLGDGEPSEEPVGGFVRVTVGVARAEVPAIAAALAAAAHP